MAWRDPWENVDRSNALRMQSDAQGINMLQALGGAQTNALQRQQLQTQMADQARVRDKQLRLENALTSVGPDADMPKIIRAIAGVDPMKAQEMARQYSKDQREGFAKVDPKDYTPESVGMFTRTQNFSDLVPVRKKDAVNGRVVDLYTAPVGEVIPKQADAPDPAKDLLLRGPDGSMTPNQPLIDVKKGLARAGATNVSVNTVQKPFLNEIGKSVGEVVSNDFNGARAAVQTLNNANQIESALSKVIVGPGANARLKLAQVGQVLGVGGKDENEILKNTRNVMQGLARQELAAAGQMKGQGQITESERGILRRAEAGDISELTVPEIKTLLSGIRKTANYRIGLHNQNLERLKSDPNAAGVVDYMRIDAPQASSAPAAPNPGGVRRYNRQTGGFD